MAASAATKVFGIAELFDMIMSQVPARTLLRFKRMNHEWYDATEALMMRQPQDRLTWKYPITPNLPFSVCGNRIHAGMPGEMLGEIPGAMPWDCGHDKLAYISPFLTYLMRNSQWVVQVTTIPGTNLHRVIIYTLTPAPTYLITGPERLIALADQPLTYPPCTVAYAIDSNANALGYKDKEQKTLVIVEDENGLTFGRVNTVVQSSHQDESATKCYQQARGILLVVRLAPISQQRIFSSLAVYKQSRSSLEALS